jgi:predicted RNA binding protein YcfA (HicA-like mRNA interferase family)
MRFRPSIVSLNPNYEDTALRGDVIVLKSRIMKVKQVIKVLEADGWYLARTRGSHRQYKHPSKSGTVTVSGKSSVDVPIGTLKNIWRQAQIEEDKI